jgi:HPt (histidine-containing phosphotransfer) domain-containing protein
MELKPSFLPHPDLLSIPSVDVVPKAVDWEQLDMVADGYDPDFLEIYREFVAELPLLFASLKSAFDSGDVVQVSRAAHQIKGSSANFGFFGVSEKAAAIEQTAKGGSTDGFTVSFAAMQTLLQDAIAEVKSRRGI